MAADLEGCPETELVRSRPLVRSGDSAIISRSARRSSFPEGDLGSSERNKKRSGILYPGRCCRQWWRRSRRARSASPRQTTAATGRLPHDSSGTPITPASSTDGCSREHSLDLGRVDVLAAGDDQIVPAVDDVEVPVAIEVARVSGAKPAVGQITRSRRLIADVTGKDCRSPDFDLADLSGGSDSASVTIRISVRGSGTPEDVGLWGACVRQQRRHLRRGLRQPVRRGNRNAATNALLDEPRRRRASAKEHAAQARRPGRVAACIEHALEHGRDDREERHAVVDGRQHVLRLKSLVEDHRYRANDAAEEDGKPADVE